MKYLSIKVSALLLVIVVTSATKQAEGVESRLGVLSGLMQQPTSSYYHYVIGGYTDMQWDSLILRAGAIVRPAFEAAGFIDGEQHRFVLFGGELIRSGVFGLVAAGGLGIVQGYLKREGADESRRFDIKGPAFSMDAFFRWEFLSLSIGHQLFVGVGDESQRSVYVAWPYSFLTLNVGLGFEW